jgi:putative transposase
VSIEDRFLAMNLVAEAHRSGARRGPACAVLGISLRTLERWQKDRLVGDKRIGPKSTPRNTLSSGERERILTTLLSPEYRELNPWQIVARLADSDTFIGSESTMYRLLRRENLLAHRSRSKPPSRRKPKELIATGPNQVWSWDITYLRSNIKQKFYYLYLIMDIFSRKIIGLSVEEVECSERAALLLQKSCSQYSIAPGALFLHSDNGAAMKGGPMRAMIDRLGVAPSFSRARVSNDNPFSESLFRTLKYRPSFPANGFSSQEAAQAWADEVREWYDNNLHSGIKFVSPKDRHEEKDKQILNKRQEVYRLAREANPGRWTGDVRDWGHIGTVFLNPEKSKKSKLNPQELTVG